MKGNEMNSEVLCPVCGCGFEEKHKIVTCEGCLTPHHHDCWDYSGRCAIYGCSSTIHKGSLLDAEMSESGKSRGRFQGKSRERSFRKPAVLTKSVSSVANSPFRRINDYLVLIYKTLSLLQRVAYCYVTRSMMVFPLFLVIASVLCKDTKGAGFLALIPMYPTFLVGYLFLILVIPVTIFRAYFKIVDYDLPVS
jgi:hypothetical protein